ncbi:hypothetical protein OC834_001922 [Tilletia horrida]|uniref:RWD domain-containing protein n=1 Tax=Tilletia horrida TaxID=155126 RepID=A0AAN6GCT3_9BASI|nr:hypothetical protein OC842_002912 [Tilletia horrida]KAK0534353.1 hypothetical protein OC834_001922 [Tilletia horrida]
MSFSVPIESLDAFRDEVELLQNSCAAGEFRPSEGSRSSSSISTSEDFDLVLSFEPEVLLRVHRPSSDSASSAAAALTLSAPAADGDAVLRLKSLIEGRMDEEDFRIAQFKIYDLFLFLQNTISNQEIVLQASASSTDQEYHLKSTTKKKNIRAWCSELRVWGITRPGYPAFLLFEGMEDDVDEMIRLVKDQNWHALSLRAHVKYTFRRPSDLPSDRDTTEDLALLACRLAHGHASNNGTGPSDAATTSSSISKTAMTAAGGATSGKLRPGVEEVEAISDLVQRLRAAGVPELEYTEALNLRT